ncbi:unnamed protein product, partial [Ectocarpus sp. 12 AP-2014]
MSSAGLATEIGDFAGTAKVKEEEKEQDDDEEEEPEQEEGQEEGARPGKRKLGSMAKALRRHSAWTFSSRQATHAESPTEASPKRQRKASAPGTVGRGTAATHKTQSSRTTARYRGQGPRCCQHNGCKKTPSYGEADSKKAQFCAEHAKLGMTNVAKKTCGHPGCIKIPSFGNDGSKKAEFCSRHVRHGMVDVRSKRCCHPGCTTRPSYGEHG